MPFCLIDFEKTLSKESGNKANSNSQYIFLSEIINYAKENIK